MIVFGNGFRRTRKCLARIVEGSMAIRKVRRCASSVWRSNVQLFLKNCLFSGQQPSNGSMTVRYLGQALPGFENDSYECPSQKSIEIVYSFPGGIQRGDHPSPGQPYAGTRRTAYLPNNDQGKEIVELLRRAFDDQQVFRIGRSITTGRDNSIIWNDIHHKTSIFGGPSKLSIV